VRKLFEQLIHTFRQFREQRDDLLLLIPSVDNDVAFLLQALRTLDQESPSDLYLLFSDDFDLPDSYVNSLVSRLQEELKLVNEAVPPRETLPALPGEVLDQRKPALDRLKKNMEYGRSLIDLDKGQRHVWGMCPLTIKNSQTYLQLLAGLTPNPAILPWMRGARIVARVPVDFSLQRSPLANAKRVKVEPFAIPPNAHEEGLMADSGDPTLPVADRMQAEVQLAYIDYAHSRFDLATERFRKALAFFQWAKIPAMEGLIISGLGDIARRRGDRKKAQHWYACATVPAAEARSPILLATVVQNLAVVAFEEERWADAEERYWELVTIKRGMLDEVGLIDALEWRAKAQENQKAFDRSVLSWVEAAMICRDFELKDRLTGVLPNLRKCYERLGMREELATFDSDWRN
jgi:tetratricopeptide (TPR) repeat protein